MKKIDKCFSHIISPHNQRDNTLPTPKLIEAHYYSWIYECNVYYSTI